MKKDEKQKELEIYEEIVSEDEVGEDEVILEESDLEDAEEDAESEEAPKHTRPVRDRSYQKSVGNKDGQKAGRSHSGAKGKKRLSLQQYLLIAIGAVVLLSILTLFLWNLGSKYVETSAEEQAEFDTEKLDYMVSLDEEELAGYEARVDDGVRTVLCLGNAPFADDYGTEDNLVVMAQNMAKGGTVFLNGSIAESTMALDNPVPTPDKPLDALSLYYITQYFALQTKDAVNLAKDSLGGWTADQEAAFKVLDQVDLATLDAIVIFYDATDYLLGRYASMPNPEDLTTYTGAFIASTNLIQKYYPWIRIIVMSPTYAYTVDENGKYVDSDIVGEDIQLSAYIQYLQMNCYEKRISMVDNYYGTIPATKADKYLTDNIHINVEGRKLLAERMVEAIEYFD